MDSPNRRTALKGLMGASAFGAALIAQSASAQAPARPAGEPPRDWIDPRTGHRIVRISSEPGSLGMYFYRPVYTPQGDLMVIKSPTGIQTVDLKTWAVKPLVEGAGKDLLFMSRRAREAYYSVTAPGGGEAGDRPKTIYAVNVDTRAVREVARIPAGGISAINADDTLLLGSVAYGAKPLQPRDAASVAQFGQQEYAALGPDGKPLSFAKAKGVRMMERFQTPVPAELFTVDVKLVPYAP